MKKLIIFGCLVLSAASLYARAVQEDYKKADDQSQVSYAFGMLMGSNLISTDLDFDYDAFRDGFRAVLEKEPAQFTDQEAMEIVETALQRAMEKKYEENRLLEEEFLAKNRERPEVQITSSGLQYEVFDETGGEKPKADSIVKVIYIGSFMNGNVFDSSEDEGALIPLNMVIPGWTEGLLLMGVGSKYKLYIPSGLAYGQEGIQSIIPPYSPLIFTVELLDIVDDNKTDSELELELDLDLESDEDYSISE
jgi:FKBP-type peptidyl-prolyl cis-trans isomerase